MDTEKKASWLERVEDLINALEGSTIGELELTEDGTEIVIRRQPGLVATLAPLQLGTAIQSGIAVGGAGHAPRVDNSVPVAAPLTGVYYEAASPTTPPFVHVGDVIQIGQVIALIEAMKVFNEVTAEVAGRVVAIVATNGAVVQKGDALLRVEPL